MWKKHPAEDFLIATREERALQLADMPPMVSILPGGKILNFYRPSGNRERPARAGNVLGRI
ncbi:hypothetical protein ES705_25301 [subsurface metagenome]